MAKKNGKKKNDNGAKPVILLAVDTDKGMKVAVQPKDDAAVEELVRDLVEWTSMAEEIEQICLQIENRLQEIALKKLEGKDMKTVMFYGNKCYAMAQMARKVTVDEPGYKQAKAVFKDFIESYITKKDEPSFSPLKGFKDIMEAIHYGEYQERDLADYLRKAVDASKVPVLLKKLKGDYLKDCKLLLASGVKEAEIDDMLHNIHKIMNWEKIKSALEQAGYKGDDIYAAIAQLKTSAKVDESLKLGVKYDPSVVQKPAAGTA